jgi:hypothetical protein
VDFATDASQNRFSTYELSLRKKDISQENEEEKNLSFLLLFLYHRAVVKQDHSMVDLLSYAHSNATVM